MIKCNLELGKVRYIKMKVSLILKGDPVSTLNKNFNMDLESVFDVGGNTFYKIAPNPFLTLDISAAFKTNWNRNHSVNLTKPALWKFIRSLSYLNKEILSKKDLYYYKNDRLNIDYAIADSMKEVIRCSDKFIILLPAIVYRKDESTLEEIPAEGVSLSINNKEFTTDLDLNEIEYFIYELKKIDLQSIALHIMTLAKLKGLVDTDPLVVKKVQIAPQVEEGDNPWKNEPTPVKIEDPNIIPNI